MGGESNRRQFLTSLGIGVGTAKLVWGSDAFRRERGARAGQRLPMLELPNRAQGPQAAGNNTTKVDLSHQSP
jgi:hypothetical protein